jgi:hypothetical protein
MLKGKESVPGTTAVDQMGRSLERGSDNVKMLVIFLRLTAQRRGTRNTQRTSDKTFCFDYWTIAFLWVIAMLILVKTQSRGSGSHDGWVDKKPQP